uniref:Large ribosomal subunit protein bL19m n=1 Tax=Macrostomum lignano TaxID=282301 RepID=A0A1I8JRA3_9PLAT
REWKGASAGGCANHPDSYSRNPCYQVRLDNGYQDNQLLIELRGPRDYFTGFDLTQESGGQRFSSGSFRQGYSMLGEGPAGEGRRCVYNIAAGVYNIVPCTSSRQEGPFILEVSASRPFTLSKRVMLELRIVRDFLHRRCISSRISSRAARAAAGSGRNCAGVQAAPVAGGHEGVLAPVGHRAGPQPGQGGRPAGRVSQDYRDPIVESLHRAEMMRRRRVINIPEFHVGSILAVSVMDKHAPNKEWPFQRVNRFVGLCILRRHTGLFTTFTLRNMVDQVCVQIEYELYSPSIVSIQLLKLERRLDDNLLYLMDAPHSHCTIPFDMVPEPYSRNDPVPVNRERCPEEHAELIATQAALLHHFLEAGCDELLFALLSLCIAAAGTPSCRRLVKSPRSPWTPASAAPSSLPNPQPAHRTCVLKCVIASSDCALATFNSGSRLCRTLRLVEASPESARLGELGSEAGDEVWPRDFWQTVERLRLSGSGLQIVCIVCRADCNRDYLNLPYHTPLTSAVSHPNQQQHGQSQDLLGVPAETDRRGFNRPGASIISGFGNAVEFWIVLGFTVGDSSKNCRMNYGSFLSANSTISCDFCIGIGGQQFSTFDRDNDAFSYSCSASMEAALLVGQLHDIQPERGTIIERKAAESAKARQVSHCRRCSRWQLASLCPGWFLGGTTAAGPWTAPPRSPTDPIRPPSLPCVGRRRSAAPAAVRQRAAASRGAPLPTPSSSSSKRPVPGEPPGCQLAGDLADLKSAALHAGRCGCPAQGLLRPALAASSTRRCRCTRETAEASPKRVRLCCRRRLRPPSPESARASDPAAAAFAGVASAVGDFGESLRLDCRLFMFVSASRPLPAAGPPLGSLCGAWIELAGRCGLARILIGARRLGRQRAAVSDCAPTAARQRWGLSRGSRPSPTPASARGSHGTAAASRSADYLREFELLTQDDPLPMSRSCRPQPAAAAASPGRPSWRKKRRSSRGPGKKNAFRPSAEQNRRTRRAFSADSAISKAAFYDGCCELGPLMAAGSSICPLRLLIPAPYPLILAGQFVSNKRSCLGGQRLLLSRGGLLGLSSSAAQVYCRSASKPPEFLVALLSRLRWLLAEAAAELQGSKSGGKRCRLSSERIAPSRLRQVGRVGLAGGVRLSGPPAGGVSAAARRAAPEWPIRAGAAKDGALAKPPRLRGANCPEVGRLAAGCNGVADRQVGRALRGLLGRATGRLLERGALKEGSQAGFPCGAAGGGGARRRGGGAAVAVWRRLRPARRPSLQCGPGETAAGSCRRSRFASGPWSRPVPSSRRFARSLLVLKLKAATLSSGLAGAVPVAAAADGATCSGDSPVGCRLPRLRCCLLLLLASSSLLLSWHPVPTVVSGPCPGPVAPHMPQGRMNREVEFPMPSVRPGSAV